MIKPVTQSTDIDDSLLEEAADWLVRLMSGDATSSDAEELRAWRDQSPAHEVAFREVAGAPLYAQVAARSQRPTDRRAFISACAGGAAVLLAGVGLARPPLGLWPSYNELSAQHRTPVGGRLSLKPADNIDVELASRTSASLVRANRGLRLISGEAFVGVRAAPTRFSVDTRSIHVKASDADFNVQTFEARDRVSCVRGEIICKIAGTAYLLSQNQDIAVDAEGRIQRARIDATKAAAWRTGRLIFEGVALAEVLDQINLYRPGRIVLRDAELGRVPLNAVFHIAQIENSIGQIEQLLGVKAQSIGGGVVILG